MRCALTSYELVQHGIKVNVKVNQVLSATVHSPQSVVFRHDCQVRLVRIVTTVIEYMAHKHR
jgi:hypothetical protein